MEAKESIEIPFGAFDSELKGWEYTIPEGMEAVIKDGKIIVREKESEDERIRKALLNAFQESEDSLHMVLTPHKRESFIAWLEKQGEHKPLSTEETELNSLAFLTELGYTCIPPTKEKSNSWSEEDEDAINHLLAICAGTKRYRQFAGCLQEDITKYQTWLKSLKERYTWKPSYEQNG